VRMLPYSGVVVSLIGSAVVISPSFIMRGVAFLIIAIPITMSRNRIGIYGRGRARAHQRLLS